MTTVLNVNTNRVVVKEVKEVKEMVNVSVHLHAKETIDQGMKRCVIK